MGKSEAANQSIVRLAYANAGCDGWRNNVGACTDQTGRQIRYGLANESAAQNKRIKSSDLIGVTPVLITPDWYGRVVGVFTALEMKSDAWTYNANDPHTQAQQAFIDIVRRAGGFAGFVKTEEDMLRTIGRLR